jgi:hypothetical protein
MAGRVDALHSVAIKDSTLADCYAACAANL